MNLLINSKSVLKFDKSQLRSTIEKASVKLRLFALCVGHTRYAIRMKLPNEIKNNTKAK